MGDTNLLITMAIIYILGFITGCFFGEIDNLTVKYGVKNWCQYIEKPHYLWISLKKFY